MDTLKKKCSSDGVCTASYRLQYPEALGQNTVQVEMNLKDIRLKLKVPAQLPKKFNDKNRKLVTKPRIQ